MALLLRASGLSVLLLATAAGAAEDGALLSLRTKCEKLLHGLAASPYSNAELAALCRARVPNTLCNDALHSLGQQPWSPQSIGDTCSRWERDFKMRTLEMSPERRAMDLSDIQSSMDSIMQQKGALGICSDKPVDECASYKATEYPKLSQKFMDTAKDKSGKLGEAYNNLMGSSGVEAEALDTKTDAVEKKVDAVTDVKEEALDTKTDAVEKKADAKADVVDAATLVELGKGPVAPTSAASRALAFATAGCLAASLVAAAGVAALARARSSGGRLRQAANVEEVQEQGMLQGSMQE